MSAGFKQGWNTFVVSVANQTLRWHLEKFTGRSASLFDGKTAYYMKDITGNPVRAANDVNEWGSVSADGNVFVGFPYWIYIDSLDISGNFLQYPLGWDIFYPNNIASSSTVLSNQSIVYGDKYVNNSRGYLQLNRKYGNSNSEYFFELRRGNAYLSHKLCIGGDNTSDEGIFRCYTTDKAANQYVEIIKQDTAVSSTYGLSSGTVNLNIYDYGNPNPTNGSKINFFNKNFTSDTSDNQFLGEINFWGNKTNNHVLAGSIGIKQNGNFGSSVCSAPADMIFKLGDGSTNKAPERLRITKQGNIGILKGIGHTNPTPSHMLHLQNNESPYDAFTCFENSSTSNKWTTGINGSDDHFLIKQGSTSLTQTFRIDTSGKVTIGSTDQNTARLNFDNTTEPKISLHRAGVSTSGFGYSVNQLNYLVSNSSHSHVFYHSGTNGDGTELLRIDGSGKVNIKDNLGLGNITPTKTIDMSNNFGDLAHINLHHKLEIGTTSNHHIEFITNNSKRMTIKNDGKVNIGSSGFTDKQFEVNGDISGTNIFSSGTTSKINRLTFTNLSGITGRTVVVSGASTFGQGNSTINCEDVSCNVLFVNTIPVTSDNRFKHNQKNITDALSTLEKLTPKVYFKTLDAYETNQEFNLNNDGLPINNSGELIQHINEAGLIAQDIQKIDELKKFVSGTDKLGLNYNSIFSYMVAALKELNQKYKNEKSKVSSLESQMKTVLERLSNLEK
tara:strand:+ start:1570 stop:3750 length:2181 start_codon:yes stop_codon:yes gene_type:complete